MLLYFVKLPKRYWNNLVVGVFVRVFVKASYFDQHKDELQLQIFFPKSSYNFYKISFLGFNLSLNPLSIEHFHKGFWFYPKPFSNKTHIILCSLLLHSVLCKLSCCPALGDWDPKRLVPIYNFSAIVCHSDPCLFPSISILTYWRT